MIDNGTVRMTSTTSGGVQYHRLVNGEWLKIATRRKGRLPYHAEMVAIVRDSEYGAIFGPFDNRAEAEKVRNSIYAQARKMGYRMRTAITNDWRLLAEIVTD